MNKRFNLLTLQDKITEIVIDGHKFVKTSDGWTAYVDGIEQLHQWKTKREKDNTTYQIGNKFDAPAGEVSVFYVDSLIISYRMALSNKEHKSNESN